MDGPITRNTMLDDRAGYVGCVHCKGEDVRVDKVESNMGIAVRMWWVCNSCDEPFIWEMVRLGTQVVFRWRPLEFADAIAAYPNSKFVKESIDSYDASEELAKSIKNHDKHN